MTIIKLLSCSLLALVSTVTALDNQNSSEYATIELNNTVYNVNSSIETLDSCSPSFDEECEDSSDCCQDYLECTDQKLCKCDIDHWWDKAKRVCKSRKLDAIVVLVTTVGLIGFSFGFIVLAVYLREKYCPDQQQTCCNLWLQKHCCKGQDLSTPSMRPPRRQPAIRRPPLVRGPSLPSPNTTAIFVDTSSAVASEDLPPHYEQLPHPPDYSPPEAPPEYADVMISHDGYDFRNSSDPILP